MRLNSVGFLLVAREASNDQIGYAVTSPAAAGEVRMLQANGNRSITRLEGKPHPLTFHP